MPIRPTRASTRPIEAPTHEVSPPPDFRDRIARLAGSTTWREPLEGHSTDPHRMTDLDVAGALALARRSPQDIGPDIAYALYCPNRAKKADICSRISTAMADALSHRLRSRRFRVGMAVNAAFELLVFRNLLNPHPDFPLADWITIRGAAESVMLVEAEGAVWRAERAFRGRENRR